mgnify:CR=1 FL=1|jgi:Predicted membrane protein
MSKAEFLEDLRRSLAGLPQGEIAERLSFYEEMIDDRIEEGLSEEEAIAAVGPVNTIVLQAIDDTPITTLVKEKIRPKRRMKTWEIVLLVLGFPVWFPILVSAAAVLFSLYVTLWSLIIACWAVFAGFIACSVAGIVIGIYQCSLTNISQGLAFIAAGLFLFGMSIYGFFICRAATRGLARLSVKLGRGIKRLFIKKEEA